MLAKDFRKQAWDNLNNKWGTFALITLIYILLTSACSYTIILALVLSGPFEFGFAKSSLLVARKKDIQLENLFDGFKDFGKSFILYLVNSIFIALWSLLFIIPGIVKSISYSMSFYVLLDNPNMTTTEARNESIRLMEGHKWRYFCLQFSFIGWILLSILTCGILLFWVIPYMETSSALFYENLKKEQDIIISTKDEAKKIVIE